MRPISAVTGWLPVAAEPRPSHLKRSRVLLVAQIAFWVLAFYLTVLVLCSAIGLVVWVLWVTGQLH